MPRCQKESLKTFGNHDLCAAVLGLPPCVQMDLQPSNSVASKSEGIEKGGMKGRLAFSFDHTTDKGSLSYILAIYNV